MTPDFLDAAIRPYLCDADALVADRMDDAAAHARLGDLATATRRLAELRQALARIVGDTRASAYRDAHRDFDPEIHDPGRRLPDPETAAAVRAMPIGGRDAGRELEMLIDEARQALVLAVATGMPDAVTGWRGQQGDAVRAWARRTLSDGQCAIFWATRHARIKAELR